MVDYVLPFSSSDTVLARAGGKGANLATLARAGFAVPPGFVITTEAYRAFVSANRLQEKVLTLARSVSSDDPGTFDAVSAEIRALFEQGSLPADIAERIVVSYSELDRNNATPSLPVAVRSSATAEDLPGLAFAGQQETYLNVIGVQAVLAAVKQCWASLWTARAMAYRARNHIAPDEIALAVVVQEMIASESSGVLFTANPLTGRRDEIVVDASFGLGEAIVAGQVEPDHYVVIPQGWKVTERILGGKAVAVVPRTGGGTHQVRQDGAQRQALSDTQIVELAQTAQRVAEHFGSPQDIEWAWAQGRLYLLQSRPITSLYPLPDTSREGVRVYISLNSLQGVVDPLTPLGLNTFQLLGSAVLDAVGVQAPVSEVLTEAGGRLFLDVTDIAGDEKLRHGLLAVLARGDPGARQTIVELAAAGRIPTKHIFSLRRLLNPALFKHPVPRRALAALRAPERTIVHEIGEAEAFLHMLEERSRAARNLADRLNRMEQDLPSAVPGMLYHLFPLILPAVALMTVIDRWLVEWLGEKPGSVLALLRGNPGNVTTEMDLKLWAVAQTIRADSAAAGVVRSMSLDDLARSYRQQALPEAAQRAIAGFLDEYGMRGVAEIDVGRRRWNDDPTYILQTICNYLELGDPSLAPDAVFARGKSDAERLAGEYIVRVRKTRFGAVRAKLLGGAIRRMRLLSAARETPKFLLVKMLRAYRTALLQSGKELAARRILDRPEDVFFVPRDALKQLASGQHTGVRNIVVENRAQYDRELTRRQIPRVLLSTGEAFYAGVVDPSAGTSELVGDPVSPGVAEGRVRVVLDPRGTRLEPGEILVCPATDPGWTPLFLTAGGLVMEIGGLVTHGAVVAREYGIPAIVGVHQATTRLRTGQRARVDGNRGRVTIIE
jgi:pyruvate,water dikinase